MGERNSGLVALREPGFELGHTRLELGEPCGGRLDDELALLFLQPDMASELFRLCQRNRDYLSQWLPWVPHIQQPSDSATFIRHAIEKFARGEGLTTAIEYQGEVVGVIGYNQIDQALAKVTVQANGQTIAAVLNVQARSRGGPVVVAFHQQHLDPGVAPAKARSI